MTQPTAPPPPDRAVLRDGTAVVFRPMGADDAERLLRFAQAVPGDDLLFLSADITDPETIAHWVRGHQAGLVTTVLAEASGEVAGYASLVTNRVPWQRHLGEIRIQVGPRHRGQGLGRALAGRVFALGRERGLRKVVAQMTPDQRGAVGTFERLGFRAEALLQDYVIDRGGRTRDLVVMTYDVTGLTGHLD